MCNARLLLVSLFSGVPFLRGMNCQGNTAGIPLLTCGGFLKCLQSVLLLLACSAATKPKNQAVAFETPGASYALNVFPGL